MSVSGTEGLLLRHEALLRGHFLLSSGLHSDTYLQCAVALQHPRAAETLGRTLARLAAGAAGGADELDAVVSPALGGVVIGHETGRALERPAMFTERVDGRMQLRRGFSLARGQRVLLVEDVVTTGRSSRETLEVIRAREAEPVAVACIANRSGLSRLDGLPLVAGVELNAPTWKSGECPLCTEGDEPVKPGSREA